MAKADKPEGAPAKPAAPKPAGGGKSGAPARGGKGGGAAAKAAPAPAATQPRSTGRSRRGCASATGPPSCRRSCRSEGTGIRTRRPAS